MTHIAPYPFPYHHGNLSGSSHSASVKLGWQGSLWKEYFGQLSALETSHFKFTRTHSVLVKRKIFVRRGMNWKSISRQNLSFGSQSDMRERIRLRASNSTPLLPGWNPPELLKINKNWQVTSNTHFTIITFTYSSCPWWAATVLPFSILSRHGGFYQ